MRELQVDFHAGIMAARDSSVAQLTITALAEAAGSYDDSDDIPAAIQQCFEQQPSHAAFVSCLQVSHTIVAVRL